MGEWIIVLLKHTCTHCLRGVMTVCGGHDRVFTEGGKKSFREEDRQELLIDGPALHWLVLQKIHWGKKRR